MSPFVSIEGARSVRGCAVVVDVLRAYTTAAWALEGGAERIVLVAELDEALALKARIPGALAFKDGPVAPGFELANSPVQLRDLDVRGRTIVQRTTAGTRGAVAVRHCEPILCASFVCADATVAVLARLRPEHIAYVVTGDGGEAEEDRACAEYLHARLTQGPVDPAPYVERARGSTTAARLTEAVERGYPGIDPGDIDACLDANRFSFAMRARLEDELLVLRREEP